MNIEFQKYHGSGNDFILIDDRQNKFDIDNHKLIQELCERRFGIGADGLILFRIEEESSEPEMIYFNSDGYQSSMCGNGGRCFASFVSKLLDNNKEFRFQAIDGQHYAEIIDENRVSLSMNDVKEIEKINETHCTLNTGSPHYIVFERDIEKKDLNSIARSIRYSDKYEKDGINVNLVEMTGENSIKMRTYERGVEAETWSCGTGVTAAAIAFSREIKDGEYKISVETSGGTLQVSFTKLGDSFTEIWLHGPVKHVFTGSCSSNVNS